MPGGNNVNLLAMHPTPLLVELELLFSCLIRKRVRFPACLAR